MNEAIKAGGESYFRYRQIEMIPQIAPVIADALAKAKLVTISGDSAEGGAAQSATSNITSVIQTMLPAQLVSGSGLLQQDREAPIDTAKEMEGSRRRLRHKPRKPRQRRQRPDSGKPQQPISAFLNDVSV